ncbi:hypothetical protein D3C75_1306580 [compost metagenome]
MDVGWFCASVAIDKARSCVEVCLNSIPGRMAVELYFSQKICGLGVQAKVVNHEGNFIDFECKVHPYLAGAAVFEGVQ